jgi:hypothetical protein
MGGGEVEPADWQLSLTVPSIASQGAGDRQGRDGRSEVLGDVSHEVRHCSNLRLG